MKASGNLQHLQCGYLSINTCRTWLISVNIQGIQLFPRKNISVNKDVNHKYNSCSFKGAYLHNCFSRISINEIAIHHVQCVMNKKTSASTCWILGLPHPPKKLVLSLLCTIPVYSMSEFSARISNLSVKQ